MTSEEHFIVRECQEGNSSRFGVLYDTYIRKIYDFIYYKTHHKQTAEDLTSEVFFKAFKYIRQFDSSRKFSSWLYGIAKNAVIDYYRSHKKEMQIDDAWDLSSNDDLPRDADLKGKLEEVKQYLKDLPSLQRDIVIMRVWQEMSYKEIAEVVGKSEGNCKVIFSRAAQKLRTAIPLSLFLVVFLRNLL